MQHDHLPTVLSIAGSDSGAGAGIQADLLTFAALGTFGTTAVTCITAQNPDGVSGVHAIPAGLVELQCRAVRDFFHPRAAKTGMLFDAAIIDAVARFLADTPALPVVVDPVMVATSGAVLLRDDAIGALRTRLLPRAALVTPNLDEAAVLLGRRPDAPEAMEPAARELARLLGAPVLLKGGHLPGGVLADVLATPEGACRTWTDTRLDTVDTHGTGCTLSAAIAARLARGDALADAVAAGRAYLRGALVRAVAVGGRRFLAHLG